MSIKTCLRYAYTLSQHVHLKKVPSLVYEVSQVGLQASLSQSNPSPKFRICNWSVTCYAGPRKTETLLAPLNLLGFALCIKEPNCKMKGNRFLRSQVKVPFSLPFLLLNFFCDIQNLISKQTFLIDNKNCPFDLLVFTILNDSIRSDGKLRNCLLAELSIAVTPQKNAKEKTAISFP